MSKFNLGSDRCACFSYGRLKDRAFSETGFRTATKILVYKDVIHTTLLHGCKTWFTYLRHVIVREQFQQRMLRAIIGVHWQDRITNAGSIGQPDTNRPVTAELGRTCEMHVRCRVLKQLASEKPADSGNAKDQLKGNRQGQDG